MADLVKNATGGLTNQATKIADKAAGHLTEKGDAMSLLVGAVFGSLATGLGVLLATVNADEYPTK